MDRLSTTSGAVLGLLSTAPMSGYQLTGFAAESIANFWPISKSQVYAELARLEEAGLVAGTDVEQEKVPDKRTYELTPEGENALDAWLAEPGYEPERVRMGFLVKVFFGRRLDPDARLALLERYRAEATEQRDTLAQVVDVLDDHPEAAFMRATALCGLRGVEAALAWCDEVQALFEEGAS